MPEVYTGVTALPNWTLYLAVVVGGVAGATYAARRGFDVIGVLALSVTTGLGGLLLRDILLGRGPIVLRDNAFIWSAVLAAVVGFFFAGYIARFDRPLLAMEALAMGLLATVGADSALRAGMGRYRPSWSERSWRQPVHCSATSWAATPHSYCGPESSWVSSHWVDRALFVALDAWTHNRCCHR
jgi:hypothetical protein